ncbi:MAG: hypothetical protein U9R79_21155 [Armatimonadota bacterium]|nr:hypothetical protein [Armatimonadota bacterium]
MRREAVVLLGAAALVTLMAIGLCGEVAAQTVMPGDTGVDLTDARSSTGMNGATEMKLGHWKPKKPKPGDDGTAPPPEPDPWGPTEWISFEWQTKDEDLILTLTMVDVESGKSVNVKAQVDLTLTLIDTGESWYFTGETGGNGEVDFVHANAASGEYYGVATSSTGAWGESRYTLE